MRWLASVPSQSHSFRYLWLTTQRRSLTVVATRSIAPAPPHDGCEAASDSTVLNREIKDLGADHEGQVDDWKAERQLVDAMSNRPALLETTHDSSKISLRIGEDVAAGDPDEDDGRHVDDTQREEHGEKHELAWCFGWSQVKEGHAGRVFRLLASVAIAL